MDSFIDDRGCLKIPLYHGTSTLFAEQICREGLGARNPVKDWNVLACLRGMVGVAENVLAEDDDWLSHAYATRGMVAQAVGPDRSLNLRHGGTYLTVSRRRAINYALDNPLGSELLSRAAWLRDKLRMVDEAALGGIESCEQVHQFADVAYEPVLVVAEYVRFKELRSESGESAEEVLDQVRLMIGEGLGLKFVQEELDASLAFEHLAVVPIDQLKMFTIGRAAEPRLTPFQCGSEEFVAANGT